MMKHLLSIAVMGFLSLMTFTSQGQTAVPADAMGKFKDTSMLKPPVGAKVAIWEFEDLECPYCAHVYPIVHGAAEHYKIPIVRHDYPLTEIHVWSFDAAVTARYLQDRVSPDLAEAFRRDVFAAQNRIAGRDDLQRFTQEWFKGHQQALPFVMDASGACKKEVQADHALGDRIGRLATPCIFVVTEKRWVQVVDINQLYRVIDVAMAEAAAPVVRKRN
jgi:protein-disulfide isomerase